MPLYEISPSHAGRSYTSPFHNYGLGAEEPPSSSVQKTVTDVVMQEEETDWMAYLSPVIAGLVLSIMSYGVARGFDVERSKAAKVAVAMGGVTALGHGLSNWLFKHTEPIRKSLPGSAAGPAPEGKPAVAQTPTPTAK